MAYVAPLPIVVIACQVFQDLFERFAPPKVIRQFTFLDFGLHDYPKKLNATVQAALDGLEAPSLVVLGYGLCGNGLNGIRAGKHTLLIPRSDDCIAVLLGSYARYRQEFQTESSTYYLSKGWLEAGSNPLQEYRGYVAKYGESRAEFLIDSLYHNYRRLALVAHSPEDLDAYREQAHAVATFCERWGMRYQELVGSTAYFERLLALAVFQERIDDDFILVPPGGELRQDQFLRLSV